MTATQIRFLTLWRRELNRFMKIKKQTIGAPLLETFLYISVFGAALGSRIDELHGIDYVVFVIPGLIMMAWAINAFSNNASSILQQKFQGAIQDQLSSPASPLELLTAFSLGGFTRGATVAPRVKPPSEKAVSSSSGEAGDDSWSWIAPWNFCCRIEEALFENEFIAQAIMISPGTTNTT